MLKFAELKAHLHSPLQELGLREQDINLYCTSLAWGPLPIRTLALKLEMQKPNVYKLIEALERHGLTTYSAKSRYHRNFYVEPPSVVANLLNTKRQAIIRKREDLLAQLPDLMTNYAQGEEPTKIRILEGETQFQEAIRQMFQEVKRGLDFFGSIDDFVSTVSPETFKSLTRLRLEKKLKLRSLMLRGKTAEQLRITARAELREVRFLKNPQAFVSSFQLSHNKVIIWQPMRPSAILIEDLFIVQMLQNMFNSLWKYGSIIEE